MLVTAKLVKKWMHICIYTPSPDNMFNGGNHQDFNYYRSIHICSSQIYEMLNLQSKFPNRTDYYYSYSSFAFIHWVPWLLNVVNINFNITHDGKHKRTRAGASYIISQGGI